MDEQTDDEETTFLLKCPADGFSFLSVALLSYKYIPVHSVVYFSFQKSIRGRKTTVFELRSAKP